MDRPVLGISLFGRRETHDNTDFFSGTVSSGSLPVYQTKRFHDKARDLRRKKHGINSDGIQVYQERDRAGTFIDAR